MLIVQTLLQPSVANRAGLWGAAITDRFRGAARHDRVPATTAATGATRRDLSERALRRLVHRIQQGDQTAFAALCSALTEQVHARVRTRVDDPRQVDLVVSSAFVEVRRLARFHGEPAGQVRTWVQAIADTRMSQWLRSTPEDTTSAAKATGSQAWWAGFASAYDSCQQREFHHLTTPGVERVG